MADLVQPTYAVTIAPKGFPGASDQPQPSDVQIEALRDTINADRAERLLDGGDEVTITLVRAHDSQAWVPIEAGPEESEGGE